MRNALVAFLLGLAPAVFAQTRGIALPRQLSLPLGIVEHAAPPVAELGAPDLVAQSLAPLFPDVSAAPAPIPEEGGPRLLDGLTAAEGGIARSRASGRESEAGAQVSAIYGEGVSFAPEAVAEPDAWAAAFSAVEADRRGPWRLLLSDFRPRAAAELSKPQPYDRLYYGVSGQAHEIQRKIWDVRTKTPAEKAASDGVSLAISRLSRAVVRLGTKSSTPEEFADKLESLLARMERAVESSRGPKEFERRLNAAFRQSLPPLSKAEILSFAKGAASRKGGIYSASEFNQAVYEGEYALWELGATKAQLELYQKACAEAPVQGGHFNSWSGD